MVKLRPRKLSRLLLSAAEPLRRVTPAKGRRRARSLDRPLIELARADCITGLFECETIVVEALGIVGPLLDIGSKLQQRILVLPCADIQRPKFAQDLARVVLLILIEHRPKVLQCVVKATQLESDSSQLKMSVGLARVNRNCVLETLDSFRVLAPLLIHESKLVLRVAIV